MKKQFETREALLQDALDYYWGKPQHRCMVEGTSHQCSYIPSKTSEGCAIGRLVELEVAKSLQESNASIHISTQFNKLPDWLKALGYNFLTRIQEMHDGKDFVNKDKTNLIRLLESHVDFSQIKFPE